jgi:hypothetical protein
MTTAPDGGGGGGSAAAAGAAAESNSSSGGGSGPTANLYEEEWRMISIRCEGGACELGSSLGTRPMCVRLAATRGGRAVPRRQQTSRHTANKT